MKRLHHARVNRTRLASGSHTPREAVNPVILARVCEIKLKGDCSAFNVVLFGKSVSFGA